MSARNARTLPGIRTYVEKFGLGACHALATALDQDLIRLEGLACTVLSILRRFTRECDLDSVLLFKANDVFATLTDE